MKPLRIATLNCLNLALPGRAFYAGVDPYSPDEYIAKTQWLATMLDRLAADFVLLQEVFHEQALSDAVRQSAGGARLWSLAVPLAGQDNDKPRLGIVWRQPWRPSLQSIAGFPQGCAVDVPEAGRQATFSRPLLKAEVQLPEFAGIAALTLFNVHLKSRRPDFVDGENPADPFAESRAQLRSLIRRGAEAAALRHVLEEAAAERSVPLVVAGDFNDEARAATTRLIADAGRQCEDSRDSAFRLFDAFDVEQLSARHDRPRDSLFTALDDGEPQRIDHVLVSEAFVPGSKGAIGLVATFEVFSDHLFERRRVANSGARLERIYSDHAAVCVTLEPVV